MKKQFILLVIMLSFWLQGCVYYIPSLSRHFKLHGVRTSRGEIDNFLEIGKTSKQEVQEVWIYPNIKMHAGNIWIYRGFKPTGSWRYFDGFPLTPGWKPLVLFVKFDNNDHVKRYKLTKFSKGIYITDDELRQKALEWDN